MSALHLLARRAQLVRAGLPAAVPSPCMSVCRMNPDTELCDGCYRTLDEIAEWGRMGEEEKVAVWGTIGERLALRQAQGERGCDEAQGTGVP